MKRREFVKSAALSVPLISIFPADLSAIEREFRSSKIEKRVLGKTGIKLSAIGFGGIVVQDASPEESSIRVKQAIDYGINYFDVAPSYGDAEIKLGPALEPYRKDIYLACKTGERKKEGARKELEQSLKNLRTDHFDIYQFHAVTKLEDVDTIFSKGGAMETFLEAKEEGKIRNIGFSAHSVEAAMEMMDRFEFDTILFPFNFATWYAGNFGPQVMAKAKEKGMGILALKAMAKQPYAEGVKRTVPKAWYEPIMDKDEANLALRFTLSHPITAAVPPGDENLFEMAMKLAVDFEPLNKDEVEEIKQKGLTTEPLFKYDGSS
ncbi:MAG: aldo/keto reductase [Bacteroidales bacterium]|nr:aldo/keto reductase [Bacteroidales bacterium]